MRTAPNSEPVYLPSSQPLIHHSSNSNRAAVHEVNHNLKSQSTNFQHSIKNDKPTNSSILTNLFTQHYSTTTTQQAAPDLHIRSTTANESRRAPSSSCSKLIRRASIQLMHP
ncbi:hypothetical protein Droror1_Dr00024202 [Drosera rotundifolia]